MIYKNAYLWVNGVDLSGNLKQLDLQYAAESLEATAMGSNSRKKAGGLKTPGFSAIFFQNFSCVDATLFALVGADASVEIRACNACSGTANPQYFGNFLLQSYPPMSGAVGVNLEVATKWDPASDLTHCAAASV